MAEVAKSNSSREAPGRGAKRNSVERLQKVASREPEAKLLCLQRALGNTTVHQLLQSGAPERVSTTALLQFKGTVCGESGAEYSDGEEHKRIPYGEAENANDPPRSIARVPSIVRRVLERTNGQPLNGSIRTFMESRFRKDFGQVRLHTDASAAKSARAVNAQAYTFGHNIVFGAGQYDPDTYEGTRLLAHELAHVVQQPLSSSVPCVSLDGGSVDPLEQAAEVQAARIADSRKGIPSLRIFQHTRERTRGSNTGLIAGGGAVGTRACRQPKASRCAPESSAARASRATNAPASHTASYLRYCCSI